MGFAARCAELCRFAAKNSQTVEETVKSSAALLGRREPRDLVATDCYSVGKPEI